MKDGSEVVPVRQRQAGCLLGLAWGDALGCPVEFWDTDDVVRVFGHYAGLPEDYPFERLPLDKTLWAHLRPLGLHSDDTQQALALIRSCLAPGGWQTQAWADLLVRGERERAWRGTGRFFRAAVKALAQGVSPLSSGSQSAGVGAAMRIAPLGALLAGQPATLARVVLESSRVTHAEPCAIAGAFAVACACAALVRGTGVDELRNQLVAAVREFEQQLLVPVFGEVDPVGAFSGALQVALDPGHPDLAASRTALCAHGQTLMTAGLQHSPVTPNHPFAPIGCAHALAAGLWPASAPQELLDDVIRQGGDTDTVGAMAGAVLGARFGWDWVPMERLWDREMLKAYADALSDGVLPEPEDAFIQREASYSAEERRFSRACMARFHG